MLAELIESMIERAGFKVTITDYPTGGDGAVLIDANEPALLAAQVLRHQREVHGLSLAQVAQRLGSSSRNAYARYEQGASVPTIDKLEELLGVVAPNVTLVFTDRKPAKAKARASSGAKRRKSVAR